jgi:Fe-Mn family superoxide dismutase
LEGADVVTILRKAHGNNQGLFNNAAQSFNHAFYWNCMKAGGGGLPTGKLATMIDEAFGSFENFATEVKTAGNTAFGSGWAWLVWTPSGLKVTKTIGADCPLTEEGSVPLLTMDVWEHAYYLNYQNMRATYVDTFMDKLVNWDFVASNLP